MLSTHIGRLRLVGMLEGASFVILVGIAMPLKHFADMPMAVRVAGLTHGVLFILFCTQLMLTAQKHDWTTRQSAVPFIAALLPFGPFVVDGRLRAMEGDDASRPA